MTFLQAYKLAMSRSEKFRNHDAIVKSKKANDAPTPCLIFSVERGEVFYYGFDGVEIQKGKHTARRAQTLFSREEVLIIL